MELFNIYVDFKELLRDSIPVIQIIKIVTINQNQHFGYTSCHEADKVLL